MKFCSVFLVEKVFLETFMDFVNGIDFRELSFLIIRTTVKKHEMKVKKENKLINQRPKGSAAIGEKF